MVLCDGDELVDVVRRGQGVLNVLPLASVKTEIDEAMVVVDLGRRAGAAPRRPPPPAREPRSSKHSPLDAEHRALGAKLVPFGGWEMPLAYPAGTLAEHLACRNGAVAFDVSHLGTVRVTNEAAFTELQVALTNDLAKIGPGRAQYTHLCADDGSVLDDIIVWWVDDEWFDVMPNASNTSRVLDAVGGEDVTAGRAIIAVQGPDARRRLAAVAPDAAAVARFHVTRFAWDGHAVPGRRHRLHRRGRRRAVRAGRGRRRRCGGPCSAPASSPPGSAPATRCGWRRACRCTATSSAPASPRSRPGCQWVVGWKKPTFRGKAALEAERERGVTPAPAGHRHRGPAPAARGLRRC